MKEAYINLGAAIAGTGMLYSCSWPAYATDVNDESKKPFEDMYNLAGCN